MQRRVAEICASLSTFVEAFDRSRRFIGHSLYFHHRTLDLLNSCGSVSRALESQCFLESLYATLASWGMHRMGDRGARMWISSRSKIVWYLREGRLKTCPPCGCCVLKKRTWPLSPSISGKSCYQPGRLCHAFSHPLIVPHVQPRRVLPLSP